MLAEARAQVGVTWALSASSALSGTPVYPASRVNSAHATSVERRS